MLDIFSSTAIQRSSCSMTPGVGILRFHEGDGMRCPSTAFARVQSTLVVNGAADG